MYPAASDGKELLLGSAEVYFNRLDANGIGTGERYLGDCSAVELDTQDDLVKRKNHATSTRGLLKQASRGREETIGITLSEYTPENLALALMGDDGYYTQGAGTVTDLAIKSCKGDRYIALPDKNLTSVTNVKKGGTTYTPVTDYIADLVQGRLYIVAGGLIDLLTHPDNLTTTYVKPAIVAPAMPKVTGGTAARIEGMIRLVARPTSGPTLDGEIWKCSISPDGAVTGWIGDEFGEFKIKCTVLEDSAHLAEPYRIIRRAPGT
jgi:hypothetical protein